MIRLIGMGPGSIKHVTPEASERIKSADRVLAFGRIAETAKVIRAEIIVINRVDEVLEMLKPKTETDTVLLASGDPCFYGILDFLQKKGICIDEVVPGLSSMQYMMAKLKKSWQDAALLSFHGRETDVMSIKSHKHSIILADGIHTPCSISRCLHESGIKGKIYAGFNLSYKNEHITEKSIGDDIEDLSTLALVVIENEMD